MSLEVVQLHEEDFREALDFINMAFSMDYEPINLETMLPAYYKESDEHMSAHFAVRDGGRIKALAGVYPGQLAVGKNILPFARIGAVAAHPASRNQGLMMLVTNRAVQEIHDRGCAFAWLSGFRQRYRTSDSRYAG